MKKITYILLLLALILFEKAFIFEIFGKFTPNIVLALAFALSSVENYQMSLFVAFFGGLLSDLSGFSLIGFYTFFYTCSVFLSSLIKKYVFRSMYAQVFMMFISYVVYRIVINAKDTVYGFISTALVYILLYFILKNFKNKA